MDGIDQIQQALKQLSAGSEKTLQQLMKPEVMSQLSESQKQLIAEAKNALDMKDIKLDFNNFDLDGTRNIDPKNALGGKLDHLSKTLEKIEHGVRNHRRTV